MNIKIDLISIIVFASLVFHDTYADNYDIQDNILKKLTAFGFDDFTFQGIVLNNTKKKINVVQLVLDKSYIKPPFMSNMKFEPGDKVIFKSPRTYGRKDEWTSMPWIGPFVIEYLSDDYTFLLKIEDKLVRYIRHLKNIEEFNERVLDIEHKHINAIDSENIEKNRKTRFFRPVNIFWMIRQCVRMGIDVTDVKSVVKTRAKLLTVPKDLIAVRGDGNCWYRCISVWMTGSEDHHEQVRIDVYKLFITDSRVRNFVGNIDDYIKENPVNILGTWASEYEIFATAIMLRTSIYVYSDVYKSWQLFGKNGDFTDSIPPNEKCLYMAHVNGGHFSIVSDVME